MFASTHSENNLKESLRFWLIEHPELNPYQFSFKKFFRKLTSSFRSFPHFIIIGVGRAGTTALYSYLIQHSSIYGTYTENKKNASAIHFFEYMTTTSVSWYKSHFPILSSKISSKNNLQVTGEFTSTYFYHPDVPKRIHELLPNIKLILILRNPIDKIYSTYYQQFRYGEISASFEETIDAEIKRIEILQNNPDFHSKNPNIKNSVPQNILRHGIYCDYLENWLKFFQKEQILILNAEDLKKNTSNILNTVFKFLEINNEKIENLAHISARKYPKMNEVTRKRLIDFYKPYNKKLNELLQTNFDWDK